MHLWSNLNLLQLEIRVEFKAHLLCPISQQ